MNLSRRFFVTFLCSFGRSRRLILFIWLLRFCARAFGHCNCAHYRTLTAIRSYPGRFVLIEKTSGLSVCSATAFAQRRYSSTSYVTRGEMSLFRTFIRILYESDVSGSNETSSTHSGSRSFSLFEETLPPPLPHAHNANTIHNVNNRDVAFPCA